MPSVKVRENEPFDVALRRFKRACEKAGVPGKLRQIEFYEKPTAKRKRKRSAAVKRQYKQSLSFQVGAVTGTNGTRTTNTRGSVTRGVGTRGARF